MGLKPLADSLVQRFANEGIWIINLKLHVYTIYRRAGKALPILVSTDRDCYNAAGSSKLNKLFRKWDQLLIRV